MQNSRKSSVISSLFWKILERSGSQGIQFIVQIVLARLLLPKDFGLIAIVTIFILIANVIVQSGFNTALIQKKDADDLDFSSAFYISLFLAAVLYSMLFISASYVSSFYSMKELELVLKVIGVSLFFGAFNSIQIAKIARKMEFKKLFISTFGAVLISGIISIFMAYQGFGVWALVTQQLLTQILTTVILWNVVKWRPMVQFSYERIKVLFSFGSKVLLSNLMDTLFDNFRSLLIGKVFSPATLGYYSRGRQFPSVIVTNIDGSIQAVMLPTLSQNQDNTNRVKSMVRRSIVTSSFIILPMMVGLAIISEPLVVLLLTEKWLPAVPFLQIFSLTYAIRPIQTANLQAIIALGRSDISLKLQIYKNVLGFVLLFFFIRYGAYAIAVSGLISTIFSASFNMYPNKRLLNYSYKEQISDIIPSIILVIPMGLIVYAIGLLDFSIVSKLLLQIVSGVIIYVVLAYLMKLDAYMYLRNTIFEMMHKEISKQ